MVDDRPPSASPSRRLRRHQKLHTSAEFLRCYRRGRRRHGTLATLHFHPNDEPAARLGITASRKVGKAVFRHRAKRRVREIFRCLPERSSLPPVDVVVHLKPAAGRADFAALKEELEELLRRITSSDVPYRDQQGRGAAKGKS